MGIMGLQANMRGKERVVGLQTVSKTAAFRHKGNYKNRGTQREKAKATRGIEPVDTTAEIGGWGREVVNGNHQKAIRMQEFPLP